VGDLAKHELAKHGLAQHELEPSSMSLTSSSRRRFLQQLAGVGVLVGLAGCQPSSVLSEPQQRRLISAGGWISEVISRLGYQAELVGVDSTSQYPAQLQQLPNIGYVRQLSAEGVLSLRPDLMLSSQDAGPPAVVQQLRAAGVKLLQFDHGGRFEGLLLGIQAIADALGASEKGRQLQEQLQQEWQLAQAQIQAKQQQRQQQGRTPPRVLFVMSTDNNQAMVAGQQTAADAMIRYAGGVNAIQGMQQYKPLSAEAALAAAPDVIVTTEMNRDTLGGLAPLLNVSGLAQTPAGQQGKLVAFDTLFLLGFTPRMVQATAALSEAIYAEAM